MQYGAHPPHRYYNPIRESQRTIYDPVEPDDPRLWIPTDELERVLDDSLRGHSLAGLPPRTRSKYVKQKICTALGYPVPPSFRKTQPRFPAQLFDVYVQKSNNLQVWNEELAPKRRYVIIRVDPIDVITKVKVVTGYTLMTLDTTGTLTKKYQARLSVGPDKAELVSSNDTVVLQPLVAPTLAASTNVAPLDDPQRGQIMPINEIFLRLRSILGTSFSYLGSDQERNRGGALHAIACHCLGYDHYRDDGQFPDVRHQLLELKLQTSPTIDLGLSLPNSIEPLLDMPRVGGVTVRVCDVRYALFYAVKERDSVTLTHLFVTTGERFFERFKLFQGKVMNKKIQIPLPVNFFD